MNEENKNLLDEITGLRQPKTSALNIRNAVKMDPEQAARDIELATKTTLPLDTVQRNRDELQQREYVKSVGNLEGFPAVERFMSDQRNAAVAVDDIENLKLTEKAIQDDIGIWSTFDNWAGGTLNRVNTLTGNFIELVGNMGDEIRDVFDTLGIPNPGIVIGEDGMSFSRDIPRDMPSILTETGKAVSEGQGYDYVPQFTWERLKGDISVRNLSGYVAEQGIQSLPDMVAAMFTLPAYIASRTEEIAEERVANDERKDVELADLGKSLVPALGVSLIERLGAKVTFGKGGVSSPLDALKATGGAAAVEGGTEFVQEGIEYLGETLGTQKEFDTGEMFDRQLAGLVAGSGMGGAIRGTTSTIEALASRTSRRVETNLESLGEQQLIDKIVEYSQSSRLRGRMADRYADFLRGTNSPREVFVTTDGIEAVKQLGVELPQSLTRQDNDLGLDTTMDIATFATEIAGNPELMEVLRPHVRLSSESLSLNEMEQHDLELEKMVERAEQSKELKAEADRIYDEVKDQIVATGRQSEATARYSARIIPAYVTTKAEALGLTPAEVYERMGLKVTGPATELREGQTLEQIVFRGVRSGQRELDPNITWVSTDESLAKGYAEDGNVINANIETGVTFDAGDDTNTLTPREFANRALQQRGADNIDRDTALLIRDEFIEKFPTGDTPFQIIEYWANDDSKELIADFLEDLGYQSIRVKEKGVETFGLIRPKLDTFNQAERNSTGQEFKNALNSARSKNPNAPSVAEYDASEYDNMRTFLLDDGKAGYAIEEDGTLVGVFKSPDSNLKNALSIIVPEAIRNGATKLDAFEGFLTEQYAKYGFVEVDRVPWDEQYRPEGWTDEMGTPDVVYMELKQDEQSTTTETSIQESVFNQEGIRRSDGEVQRADGERGRNLPALEGAPSVKGINGPIQELVNVAEAYAAANGIDLKRQAEYVDVDPEFAARVADAYEQMEHNPSDPAVKEAYQNLIEQTMAQYQALVDAGYQFWFVDLSRDDNLEYIESPWNAMRDIAQNKQMGIFPTNEGFGTDVAFDPEQNPLLADTGLMWPVGGLDGEMVPVLANDLFRAVHDAFGHGLEGAGFRARGEENAWQAHVRLFTGSAVGAITSETRGQNSWLNYGPHGENNRTAKVEDTVFADQKTGLMPEWTWTENRAPDAEDRTYNQFAGQFSATAPRDQLQRAVAMEDADVSMGTIRRETGWHRGADNQWRYEISDDKASFKTDITDEMRDQYRDRVERDAEVSKDGNLFKAVYSKDGMYASSFGHTESDAIKNLVNNVISKELKTLPGGFRGVNGLGQPNGTTVGKILNHPELFEAYPFLRDYKIKAMDDADKGDYGAFYPGEKRIEVNTDRTDGEILSTVLHELQHVIQNYEGFAGGGNMSVEFVNAVQDAVDQMAEGSQRMVDRWIERNAGKMDKAARAAELAQNGLMYQSMQKLIDYANHDRPSSVFRHVRNHVQWIYTGAIQNNDELRRRGREIERMFYDIPRRGPKRNAKIGQIAFETAQLLRDAIPEADMKLFKEDARTLNSMTNALRRDANKAQQPLKTLRGLKRDAAAAKTLQEATKYKTPYQVYRALAGEIEARTTQARQNLTPEEREARDPNMDVDTPRQEAIVVMGSLELKIPNVQSSTEQPSAPRGSVTFTPNNEAIIRLGQASDLSTFIHESGHLFLEMEGKFAKEFGITEDQQTILDWLGVESFDDIQVEQHEQFARGFEAYTREGKAPSIALRDAFAAFRRWLLRIYRDITQLNVNLTDDVRGVMDRMLATEREIEEALSAPNYEELFRSKEQAGMTDAEWEKYQKTLEKRRNAATQTIDEKLLKEYTRRKTQEWNEEKAPLMEQERERLSQLPVYQIMSDARQFPMDYDALKEMVGVDKLPGKFIGLAKKDGIDPQEYAETYGYNNVTQMYNAIVDAQPLKKAADEAAEAIMIQKYGDILNDGSIEEEVREAVHNEEQASLLLQELNALKPPRAQAINTQQIKLNARNTISKMKYAEIKPNKYNRAEIRAAQNAARATSKEEQYQYKLQQVVNHHLYREAIAAREAMIKQRKYIRGVQKREYSAKQIAPEYITNMKLIANMYDMRQKPAQTMAIEQVLAWYQTQMNDPNDFAQLQLLDVNLVRALAAQQAGELATFELPTFDDLTAEDLQSTYDMLRHLRHVGGQMSDVAKAEFQQEVDVLSASIEQHGGRDVKDRAGLPGKHTDLKRKLSHLINLIPSLRNLMRKLDGFTDGAAYDSIYRRIEDAQNKKLELGVEMFKRFETELKDIHKIGLSKKDHKTYITDDGMEIDITSEHRFMMALYWGTESSRDAIRDGWNLTDGDVSRILADMPDEQIDLLNAVWKVNESMWPELSAASTRLYGVAPPKLTPTPFSINGKQLSGGHMRLFYDSSELEMKSEQEDAAKMSTIVPSRAGSLYERVGSGGRAPLLDVNNMVRAIEDNVHFIAFAEAGRTVAALMNNNGVKDVMERKHGRGFRKALVQNLENITSNRPAIETLPVIPQVSRLVRHALTMKYLAYSLRNAIQGIPSIKTAMDEVGFTPFVGAFTRFVSPSSHKETVSFVQERSAFMKNRSSVINREASEYLNKVKITGRAGHAWDLFRAYGFTPQTIIDSFIAYPAWVAKYEAAMMDHGDEQRAASQADTAVAESVGSGSDLHLGAAMQQNNTEFVKTMTVFGSWFNNYYQRIYKSTEAFTDFRNRETLQALITTPFAIATLSALLIMDFPDADGDDDEQWGEWMLKRYTGFMAGTVPLLRDINSAFGGFTPKTPLSSVAELPKRLTDEIGAVADDRQTPLKTASDIINLTTTVVPVPGAGNVTRVMNFIDSDMQGNETGSGFEKTYQALVEGPNRN